MSSVSKTDEENLLNRYEMGDKIAREEMILKFKPMVKQIVGNFFKRNGFCKNICRDDLQQSGMLGLIKAFDTFDRGRGVRFSTYAYRCIQAEICDEIRNFRREEEHMELQYKLSDHDNQYDHYTYSLSTPGLDSDLLNMLKGKLAPRELDVCRLLLYDESMNNAEIGGVLGITRERVRQIRANLRAKEDLRSILWDYI